MAIVQAAARKASARALARWTPETSSGCADSRLEGAVAEGHRRCANQLPPGCRCRRPCRRWCRCRRWSRVDPSRGTVPRGESPYAPPPSSPPRPPLRNPSRACDDGQDHLQERRCLQRPRWSKWRVARPRGCGDEGGSCADRWVKQRPSHEYQHRHPVKCALPTPAPPLHSRQQMNALRPKLAWPSHRHHCPAVVQKG